MGIIEKIKSKITKKTDFLSGDDRDLIERNKRIKEMERQRTELKKAKQDEKNRSTFNRIKKYIKTRPTKLRPVQGRPSQTSVFGKTIAIPVSGSGITRGTGKVGRPAGQFKNPAGVPAQVWYKIQRQQRRQAQIQAERINQIRQQQLAQRGIPPNQIQASQTMPPQQIASPMPSQMPQNQVGQVMPPQRSTIWGRSPIISQEPDLFGQMKQKTYGVPESFWN